MKRQSWLRLFVLVSLLVAAGPAHAVVLDIVPTPGSVPLGTPASVALNISGLTGDLALGTFDLDLNFDPTIPSLTGATYGTGLDVLGLGSLQLITLGTGTVNLFELSFDFPEDLAALQADNFLLATLSFATLTPGISALGLSVNALGDAYGEAIAAEWTTATLTVTDAAAPVPEPSTLLLLASGLAGMGGVAWRRHRRGPARDDASIR